MISLKFDVESAKQQLTQVFSDRVDAQGAVYNVLNVNISDPSLDKMLSDQSATLAAMRTDLQTAQTNGQDWLNNIQPNLTVIPQATINYAAAWNSTIPLILAEMDKSNPDRDVLQSLFQGLNDSIHEQTTTLTPLLTTLQNFKTEQVTNADNFSNKNENFNELEEAEKSGLEAARAALEKIDAIIDSYTEEIDVDLVSAEKDLEIASIAGEVGGILGKAGEGGEVVEALSLIVRLSFIISATFSIDEALSLINQRLQAAQEAGEYKLEMNLLTAQLINLNTASSALSSLVQELADLIGSLQTTIDIWNKEATAIGSVVSALGGTSPVNSILDKFDLGQTQAEWDELSTFATKWQTIEVSPRAHANVTLTNSSNPSN